MLHRKIIRTRCKIMQKRRKRKKRGKEELIEVEEARERVEEKQLAKI